MTNERYDLLMGEMKKIADTVTLYPENLQEKVFNLLYSALTGNSLPALDDIPTDASDLPNSDLTERVSEEVATEVADWNHVEELTSFGNEFGLADIDGIDFAATVVYFLTVLTPDPYKSKTVSAEQFEEACLIVGHPVGDKTAALYNATRGNKKYLQGGKRAGYCLTSIGINFVKNTVLKPKSK